MFIMIKIGFETKCGITILYMRNIFYKLGNAIQIWIIVINQSINHNSRIDDYMGKDVKLMKND